MHVGGAASSSRHCPFRLLRLVQATQHFNRHHDKLGNITSLDPPPPMNEENGITHRFTKTSRNHPAHDHTGITAAQFGLYDGRPQTRNNHDAQRLGGSDVENDFQVT